MRLLAYHHYFLRTTESSFLTLATRERRRWTKAEETDLKIRNKPLRQAFVELHDWVESNPPQLGMALAYLLAELRRLTLAQESSFSTILLDVHATEVLTIKLIVKMLTKHFAQNRASRLPVIAVYTAYQALFQTSKRYYGKHLAPLNAHTSSDKHGYGDIDIWNEDGSPFETVEIKHRIPITPQLVFDVVKKTANTTIKRCYILTTNEPNFVSEAEENRVDQYASQVKKETGIDVISNGIIPSLKYYLRFVENYDDFLTNYTANLITDAQASTETSLAHIESWQTILKTYLGAEQR